MHCLFQQATLSISIIIIISYLSIQVTSFSPHFIRSSTVHYFHHRVRQHQSIKPALTQMATRKSKSKLSSASPNNVPHVPKSLLAPSAIQHERTRILTKTAITPKKISPSSEVIYWMKRDMRVQDNWALITASHFSQDNQIPLKVVYTFPPPESLPQRWTERYVTFLYQGLVSVEKELTDLNIPLEIHYPSSLSEAQCFVQHVEATASVVVCDFSPLRYIRQCKEEVSKLLDEKNIPLYEVDAHNIIPAWHVSDKREIGARTLRPKINRLLPQFCDNFPTLTKVDDSFQPTISKSELNSSKLNLKQILKGLNADTSVKPTEIKIQGGTMEGMKQFQNFLNKGLKTYDSKRNNPNFPTSCSSMSYWINFGHVSFQRLALIVRAYKKYPDGTTGFMEEGLVRRELSDNYVFYTPDDYDALTGALGWAQQTLDVHDADEREWVYSKEELEQGLTHDDLWNAAQLQVVHEGGMHGFLRMYWAKKILEWTPNSATALEIAQHFNDKYALDGNDPNGYVGVGWSIMAIHDQGWKEREIFGKIRFMNYAGCKRKFKVDDFVLKYKPAKENSINALRKKNGSSMKGVVMKSGNTTTEKKRKSRDS